MSFAHACIVCLPHASSEAGSVTGSCPNDVLTFMYFHRASCLHALYARHVCCKCSLCISRVHHALVSSVPAASKFGVGIQMMHSEDEEEVCAENGAFRCLITVRKDLVNSLRERHGAMCTYLRRGLHFLTFFIKLFIRSRALYARLGSCVVCSGAGPPRARASVLSAPVQSHAIPLWGPRRAAGVGSAASAPLADPGSSPMTAGWAGQFMPNSPHLAARAPPNTARGMGKGEKWQLRSRLRSQLRNYGGNYGRNWGY